MIEQRVARSLALEAAVVTTATVGVSLLSYVMRSRDELANLAFTNPHLVSVLGYEALLVITLVPWLRRRGWNPRDIVASPEPVDVARGLALAFATYILAGFAWSIVNAMFPGLLDARPSTAIFTGAPATPLVVLLLSVLNPIFEEFLWLGFAVTRFAPAIGIGRAAAISILLRSVVHLYQGAGGLVMIVALGIVFTVYYARARRLWPVIVAHMIFDAIGLAARLPGR